MSLPSNTPSLQLTTPSGTDLWRKPPSVDSTSAPSSLHPPIPLSSFKSAQVTITAPWVRRYDQGGLVLYLPDRSWVKTGIEFEHGRTNVGTVATPGNGYSDWSLLPIDGEEATIRVEREGDGPSLLVFWIRGEQKDMIREVTWVGRLMSASGAGRLSRVAGFQRHG